MKGSYLLILQLQEELRQLTVGRLGCFDFAPGYYLYVGSAFGPGGLAARLAHHQRREKAHPHWHLDYLRSYAALLEAWTIAGAPPLEQAWCAALATVPDLQMPVRGFGASDTRRPAHLFYTPTRPPVRLLTEVLLQTLPLDTPESQLLRIEINIFHEKPRTNTRGIVDTP